MQQRHLPARELANHERQRGAEMGEQSTYEVHAAKFLEARQAVKAEKFLKKEGNGSSSTPPCGGKGLKRPAAALKRPAAKRPREEEKKVNVEGPQFQIMSSRRRDTASARWGTIPTRVIFAVSKRKGRNGL